jgi:hypothetical protein
MPPSRARKRATLFRAAQPPDLFMWFRLRRGAPRLSLNLDFAALSGGVRFTITCCLFWLSTERRPSCQERDIGN